MHSILKSILSPAIAVGARSYIRFAPGSAGKEWIYEALWKRAARNGLRERIARTAYDVRMFVDPADLIQSMIYLTGRWEPQVSRHIVGSLRPGDVFVDVGANVGHHTLLAARAVGPTGHVFAFEASPGIHSKLARNVELNEAEWVETINAAVASAAGQLEIWLAPAYNIGHSTTVAGIAQRDGMSMEAVVRADRIDRLMPEDKLYRARLVKIDVEGAERSVLEPLASSMHRFHEATEWLLELSADYSAGGQADVDWIFALFRSSGYTAYQLRNPYELGFYLESAVPEPVVPLKQPPTESLTDVLFSRRQLTVV